MADQPSLKNQAEAIIEAVDRDVQAAEQTSTNQLAEIDSSANALMKTIFGVVSDVDIGAATARVRRMQEKFPDLNPQNIAQKLISEKCQRTGAVGAVTSGAGLIPGLGTAAATTLGVAADIGATFKLQAELVLEIAAAYDYPLTEQEKQQIVLFITGLSAGTAALARTAGQRAALKIGERFAERAFLKALPVLGVIGSAGTNVLSTYIIGIRADAYFRLGPEAVGTWADSVRAITGIDEQQIGTWLVESGKATRAVIITNAGRVGEAATTAGGVIGTRAKQAGDMAVSGGKWYLTRVTRTWSFLFGFIWGAISYLPRKIIGWFRRDKN